jgi:hypothetical protein
MHQQHEFSLDNNRGMREPHRFLPAVKLLGAIVLILIGRTYGSAPHGGDGIAHIDAVETSKLKIKSRPERGRLLDGDRPTPESMYEAYRELELDYHEKAFRSKDWKTLNRKDGVEISILQHPSDPTCPYVKIHAILPVSVQDCWNFLLLANWDDSMPKMDPFYEGVKIFGEYQYKNVHIILARKRTKRILAFGKRDFCFLSVTDEPLPDGTWVSGSVSVKTPMVPREKGYTRGFQDSIAFYKPLEDNTKTALTIICRIDLNDSSEGGAGGFVPMWIYVKTIGKTGAMSVIRMRQALIEQKQLRLRMLEERKKRRESLFQLPTHFGPKALVVQPPKKTSTLSEVGKQTEQHMLSIVGGNGSHDGVKSHRRRFLMGATKASWWTKLESVTKVGQDDDDDDEFETVNKFSSSKSMKTDDATP